MGKPVLGVMLYVSDLPRSVAFYRDVMGFGFSGWWDDVNAKVVERYEDLEQPAGYAGLKISDSQLIGLHPSDEPVAVGGVFMHVYVDDIRAAHAKVTEAGGEPSEPELMPWHAWMFTLKDPDGHPWGFVQEAAQA